MTSTQANVVHRTSTPRPQPHRQTPVHAGVAAEPADQVHLASPQAAAQAALHPILEPAVQFALVTGFMLAAGNAQGSAIPLVTVDAALKAMGKDRFLTYTIDLKNEDTPVATGSYGEEATDRLVAKDKGPMCYEGPDGTHLELRENKQTKAIELDGKLQGLDAHLTVKANPPAHPDDDLQGFHTEGTIGGQPYVMDSTFAIDPSTKTQPKGETMVDDLMQALQDTQPKEEASKPEKGKMVAHGQVAGQTIHKDYDFTETDEAFGATITLNGTGPVGPTRQDAQVTLTLVA